MRARFGRGAGEMQARRDCGRAFANEIQTRSRRDSPAALPLRRSAGGESTGSADPNSPSGAGSSGGSRTATGARQRSAGEKQRGGVSLAPSEPHAPPPRHRPCCLLWTTFATTGRRTSIQTLRLGSAPSASAATSSPHSAPQQCDPNDCGWEGGIGDERCTVVGAVEAREDGGVPAPRPQCLGTRGARRSGSASSRSWA